MLRQGISVGASFGLASLEELARVGLELEEGVYRTGSLVRVPAGVRFRLTNPPLRIGAFHTLRVYWDGVQLDPDLAHVATERCPELRPISAVDGGDPLVLGVGESSTFSLTLPAASTAGRHRIRVEWVSVAVPPVVWLEFVDVPGAAREGD